MTIDDLIMQYESDAGSPYHDLRQATRRMYGNHLRRLGELGTRQIETLTGATVRAWYKARTTECSVAYAYLSIAVLKAVVSYGAENGMCGCAALRAMLSATRFATGEPRKTRMSYSQVCAFRNAAHRLGAESMALGLTVQYELALRQRDVIGEWTDVVPGIDGIRARGRAWRDGLTWSHIGMDGVLRKRTSKTQAPAAHRIADYPDLTAELAHVPAERRIGPLVINEATGLPYSAAQYRRRFREIARAAGISDAIWSMDARAGAITEAYEAGASTEGAMALAMHAQAATSRRYLRDYTEQASRVARLRVAARGKG